MGVGSRCLWGVGSRCLWGVWRARFGGFREGQDLDKKIENGCQKWNKLGCLTYRIGCVSWGKLKKQKVLQGRTEQHLQ